MNKNEEIAWDLVIDEKHGSIFHLNLKELWKYKDLLLLFVKRDITAVYKQTILGPLWFIIQPLLTSLTFTVFGNLGQLSTSGQPRFLFYLTGITCWNYFADCLNNTSNTFIQNASIFGKVYFPRIIVPFSLVLSSLLKFLIQLLLLVGVCFYYYMQGANLQPNSYILLIPFLVLLMGLMGLAFGILISSFTTKYRDLRFLVAFGVQLMMFFTTVLLPFSEIKGKMKVLVLFNPMTPVIEAFKAAFFSPSYFQGQLLLISSVFTFVLLYISLLFFNRVEKNFMDTV